MNDNSKKYIIDDLNLMSEWHWEKNNEIFLNPHLLTMGSQKRAWWKCKKGHEWQATIGKRSLGRKCPFCSNRKLLKGYNDLATKNKMLLSDWDYEKNQLNPSEYVFCSREKVFWKCNICNFEWMTSIHSRTIEGTKCPSCMKKERGYKKHISSLKKSGCIKNKLLLMEWDYEKNKFPPTEYTEGCSKEVFWKCSKCGYSYEAKISNRAKLNRGCPLCSNNIVVKGINDLATTHPELIKEWDYDKNGILPEEITYGCGKKVWWRCTKGHSYEATVNHRTGKDGTNCPICFKGQQTSFAEQALFFYIKKIYPDAINGYKKIFNNSMELDVYIPSIRLGIEYDGEAWHKEKHFKRELKKYSICKENEIKLYRLKEKNHERDYLTADKILHMEEMYKKENLFAAIHFILSEISKETNIWTRTKLDKWYTSIDVNLDRDEMEIRKYMSILNNNSLKDKYPILADEWLFERNGGLTPDKVKTGSDIKVWWRCPKCQNEYQATISHRVSGTGCPKCGVIKSALKRGKRVRMLNYYTKEYIKTFNTISEASRELHISTSNICAVLNGKRKRTKEFSWEYE